jgi:hypothetical protein
MSWEEDEYYINLCTRFQFELRNGIGMTGNPSWLEYE